MNTSPDTDMTLGAAFQILTSPNPTVPALFRFLRHVHSETIDKGSYRSIRDYYPSTVNPEAFTTVLTTLSADHWPEVSDFIGSLPFTNAMVSFVLQVGNEHIARLPVTPLMEQAIVHTITHHNVIHFPLSPAMATAIPEPLFARIVQSDTLLYFTRSTIHPDVITAILNRPHVAQHVTKLICTLHVPYMRSYFHHFLSVVIAHPLWGEISLSLRKMSPKFRVLLLVSPQSTQLDIEAGLAALGQLKTNPLEDLPSTPCDFACVRWEQLKPVALLQALIHLYYSVKSPVLTTNGPSQHLIEAGILTAHLKPDSMPLVAGFRNAQSYYLSASQYQVDNTTWLPNTLRLLLSPHGSPDEFYALTQRIVEWVQGDHATRQTTGAQLLHYLWRQYSRDQTSGYAPPASTLTHQLLTLRPPFLFEAAS